MLVQLGNKWVESRNVVSVDTYLDCIGSLWFKMRDPVYGYEKVCNIHDVKPEQVERLVNEINGVHQTVVVVEKVVEKPVPVHTVTTATRTEDTTTAAAAVIGGFIGSLIGSIFNDR